MADEHTPQNKRMMGKVEWIALIAIILLVGYILMNKAGVKVVDQSESVSITNNPRKSGDFDEFKKKRQKQLAKKAKHEMEAEGMLLQFVEDYRKTGNRDLKNTDIKFLEQMDDRIKENGSIKNAQNYYTFMKHSFQFYKTMKNISDKAAKRPDSNNNHKERAEGYIDKLFKVEQEKLEVFTEEDPSTKEWIEFLDGE